MPDCPKCGVTESDKHHRDEIKYYKGDILISHNKVIDATTLGGPGEEWLVYTCHSCGYKHKEPCKDAEQANT